MNSKVIEANNLSRMRMKGNIPEPDIHFGNSMSDLEHNMTSLMDITDKGFNLRGGKRSDNSDNSDSDDEYYQLPEVDTIMEEVYPNNNYNYNY